MTRTDWIALLLSLAAFVGAAFVADQVYERMPHIEDEMAFAWQARVIERGALTALTPLPNPSSFKVPFVVDYQGRRFGKYPIGWPVLLSFGEKLGARHLVNPVLTGLAAWFLYRLVKKLLGEGVALLAVFLTVTSPFVMMNGGSLLSHPLTLLLAVVFQLAWLDAFTEQTTALPPRLARRLPAVTAALALGLLALTRPWTAVGIALPFAIHGMILLARGSGETRARLAAFGLLAASISALHFAWQMSVTGNLLLNPYTLWWPYDTVGFGAGIGRQVGGYQPAHALVHTLHSLYAGNSDLFGWPKLSWLFLPIGLIAIRKKPRAWPIAAVMLSLVAAYAFYWTPSWTYGPRYYYEALASPILLTAAGVRLLTGSLHAQHTAPRWRWTNRLRFTLAAFAVGLLVGSNLLYYLPLRVGTMRGLYGISSDCTRPFQTALSQIPTPALVFVHIQEDFFEYACMTDLNSPMLDSDVVIAASRGDTVDASVTAAFPGRGIFHYYPDTRMLLESPREIPPIGQTKFD